MQTFHDYRAAARGAVAALGNFDGVHRGHQGVIGRAGELARAAGAPLGVVTFEPHPRQYMRPADPPFRLTLLASRQRLLAALGVELLYAVPFDAALMALEAEAFVDQVLVQGLGLRHAVVGYDFVFGKGRSGTVATLQTAGHKHGFGVTVVPPVTDGGIVYSSTRIRDLLQAGDPVAAADLLGHWWEVEGVVEQGDQRGRQLGFPTANVALGASLIPRLGVYAVRAGLTGPDGLVWHDGVANIGLRPTFGKDKVALEVHLLDFAGDLYGQTLRVAFTGFIRGEQKFAGLDALKAQISADRDTARALLAAPGGAAGRFGLRP